MIMKHIRTFESINEFGPLAGSRNTDQLEKLKREAQKKSERGQAVYVVGIKKGGYKLSKYEEEGNTYAAYYNGMQQNIEESVNEGKNSAAWTSPKTGKSYDIQKNGNRWEMDIMKKDSSIYDKVTTIKRKTPQELKDWLDGYKIDSQWMEHLIESINEAKSITQKEIEKLLGDKGIELKYDYTFDWDNLNFHNNKSAAKKAKSILDRKGIGTGAIEYLFGSNYLKVNDLKSE